MEGTDPEKARTICEKFVARGRALATDGFIVYDIQEEKGRVNIERPFPFRKMMEPGGYGKLLKEVSGKDSIVYKCIAEHEGQPFENWVDETSTGPTGVNLLNLVGGATSSREYSGPTMPQASKICADKGVVWGGVTIAERHLKKGNEHTTIASKVAMGARWFISQAIYDPEPMIKLINDYGDLCKKEGTSPVRIILTFAPCGRKKTMSFIHWLGVHVPEETETAILTADSPVNTSVELLCSMLQKIMVETGASGVPIGVSVESVSIFREEIDATHELFRRTQAMLLDNQGMPWLVRWSVIENSDKRTSFDTQRPALPAPTAPSTPALPSVISSKGKPSRDVKIKEAIITAMPLVGATLLGFVLGNFRRTMTA